MLTFFCVMWFVVFLRRSILQLALLSIGFFAYGQTTISTINTTTTSGTSSNYTATSPSDARNTITANTSYKVNHGTGNNVKVSSYVVGGTTYDNFLEPDTLIIRRTDGGRFVNIWYTMSQLNTVPTPDELDLDADKVSDADALYQTGAINAGYDNILVNVDNQASGSIQAQVERIDVIWYSGLVSCAPANSVFPIIERGGNDEIKIAAITGLDANGDPSSYTSMVDIEDSDWPGSGISNDDYMVLRRQVVGQNPLPLINVGVIAGQSAQIVQGVAVSFSELGISSGDVVYGYSIFAFDVNDVSHTLTDITTFPTNTTAANSGLDLVAGVSAAVSSDDCLVDATGPGGYKSALATWFKANEGVTTATDGSTVTDWQDAAVANNDATDYTGNGSSAPTYRSTSSTINFNPTIDFTVNTRGLEIADATEINTDGSSEGSNSYASKGINLAFRTGAAVTNKQTIYSQGDDSRGINIYIRSGKVYVTAFNTPSDGSGAPWNSATVSTVSETVTADTEYIVTLELNGNSGGTGTVTAYLNGRSIGSFSSVGLLYNHNSNGYIGFDDGNSQFDDGTQSGTGSFEGELSELVYCNEPGSSFPIAQRNRIESYLALKYGITLDQSTATNYVNSAGNTIFDATNLASIGGYLEYNNDIAGIGRDDDSELDQRKSKSENANSIVTIDKGAAIGVDNTWLIWGNDDGALTETSLNTPDTVDMRLTRIWRVAEENEMGQVTVSFDITGLGLSSSAANYSLLIGSNSSGGDFSNATVVTGATLNSNVVTFTGVSLADGEYFTLGTDFFICSPGGVETALSLWYKADAGTNTTTNASDVTSWADQSINGNNASEENGGGTPEEPTYRTNVVNYNPVIRFTDPGTSSFSYLRSSSNPATEDMTLISVFATTQSQGSNDFWESPSIIGGDEGTVNGATAALGVSSGKLFGKIKADDNITNNVVSASTYTDGVFRIGSVTRVKGASGALELYVNSENVASGTSDNNTMNLSTAVGIGNSDAAYIDAQFAGDIPEVVVYSDDLGSDELNRIDSYLGVKYGLTKVATDDGGTASIDERDYRKADGTAIWDYSVRTATYYNDIAGIGRDDRSCFIQKQSKSENTDAIVAMGLGSIADDNASNANAFTSDGDFLVWGNDNTASNFAGRTTGVTGIGNVTERMTRIWNVQETGTVGATTIQFDLSGLGYSNVLSDFQLITSGSSDLSSATLTQAASLSNNILTFNNVDLTNGQFFTIGTARSVCGPGNVTSGLVLWLEADGGTNTTVDGGDVTSWDDQSVSGNDASEANQGGTPDEPTYQVGEINYNPSIQFTDPGTTANSYLVTGSNPATDDMTLIAVFETAQSSGNSNFNESPALLGAEETSSDADYGIGLTSGNLYTKIETASNGTSATSASTYNNSIPHIATSTRVKAASGAIELYLDSEDVGTGTSDDTSLSGPSALAIGNHQDAVTASQFAGQIPEVLVYNTVLSSEDRNKVESYLALKYGITRNGADDVGTVSTDERDYRRADGTAVWDYSAKTATYYNDIAGIGRDDNSCWTQKQSRSENTDDILAIGLGTIAADNASNANSFSTDGDFMVWGNDNGATDQDNANTADVPGIVSERMTRIWTVQETGTVGDVSVSFDLTGLTGAGDYSTTASDYLLIISSSSTMASGTTTAGGTFNGSVLTFTGVDFSDGDFFTLGTAQSNCGPGGVNSNIALWYKANAGTNTTTDGADLTSWTDQGTGSNNGSEVDQGGFTPVEPIYKTSSMNFNPTIRFTDSNSNNNSYIRSSSNAVSGDMTLISVFSSGTNQGTQDDFVNTPALIGADNTADGLDYGLGIENGQIILNASDGVTFDVETTETFTDSEPHIATATRDVSSGAAEIYVDSKSRATGSGLTTTLSTPTSFGIGNHSVADVQAQFAGDIAETIVYSTVLSDLEIAKVESYLALKYGITKSNDQDGDATTNEVISGSVDEGDYVAGDGDIVWDYAAQGATYFNDIFGIARDDVSCFSQTQSKSENDDAIVTFNNTQGFSTDDAWLISGNDNAALEATRNFERPATIKSRLNREWKVQETGTVGQIELTYDLSSVTGTPFGDNNLNLVRLMVDADGDFSSGVTLIEPNSTDGAAKTVTFLVDFTDGQYYTLGSTEIDALPVTLLSFNASSMEDQVEVSWSTAQEINNAFFTIERSRNGREFETVGFLEGAGNSNRIRDYVYYDSSPIKGTSYYRLKQTDTNGQFDYSEIRRVNIETSHSITPNVIPNPVNTGETFKVIYPVEKEERLSTSIHNSQGLNVDNRVVVVKPDKGEFEISASNLLPGVYLLKIFDQSNNKTTVKFIVR